MKDKKGRGMHREIMHGSDKLPPDGWCVGAFAGEQPPLCCSWCGGKLENQSWAVNGPEYGIVACEACDLTDLWPSER